VITSQAIIKVLDRALSRGFLAVIIYSHAKIGIYKRPDGTLRSPI
jgi:hypothetical protein